MARKTGPGAAESAHTSALTMRSTERPPNSANTSLTIGPTNTRKPNPPGSDWM
nr:hypothetical protein [Natronomonas sp. CBA1123]